MSDFASYTPFKHKHFTQTASGHGEILGFGTIFVRQTVNNKGDTLLGNHYIKISPAFYIPACPYRLLSTGSLKRAGYHLTGDENMTMILKNGTNEPLLSTHPQHKGDKLEWFSSTIWDNIYTYIFEYILESNFLCL